MQNELGWVDGLRSEASIGVSHAVLTGRRCILDNPSPGFTGGYFHRLPLGATARRVDYGDVGMGRVGCRAIPVFGPHGDRE
jgi:hypothetical protein